MPSTVFDRARAADCNRGLQPAHLPISTANSAVRDRGARSDPAPIPALPCRSTLQKPGMRGKDDALPAGTELQTIVDIVEIHREQHFVHTTNVKVVLPSRN